MRTPLHSIRWRIQVWHGLILLVVVVAFCLTAYRLAWNNQQRRIDRAMIDSERLLMVGFMRSIPQETGAEAGGDGKPRPPPPEIMMARIREGTFEMPRDVASHFSGNAPGYFYFLMLVNDGAVKLTSSNVPEGRLAAIMATPPHDEVRTLGALREGERVIGPGGRIVIGHDITPELEELRRFALSLAASGLGVWLLGLLGGWWLAGRAIKPIATISATATRIAEGNLEQRISTDGTESEFDQLSRVLNDTFDRLHSVLKQQKQFTADASHELRTPVTILLSETHRILKRERTPAEYQDVIRTCHAAAERMRRLVEGMLLLARQDNDAAGPRTPAEACDLAAIARSSLEQLRPLAAERGIEVHAALQPAECRGDASALSILVNNLVGNAIQHHGSPGNVWIECGSAEGGVFLEVRDDGPGIRAEDLPHIFERFYRADKARGAAAGHTGLGLAIVKRIAENHRGGVVARSEAGKGASFRVTLPR